MTSRESSIARDTHVLSVAALVYSLAMSIQAVLLPLLALATGYSKPQIGILTALSAVTQLAARIWSPTALRYVTDRYLIAISGIALALSGFMLAISAVLVVFVLAELIQGVARGMFWTSTLTHVVRQEGPSVGRMATVNFISSFGLLAGPTVAGLTARYSLPAALILAGVIASLTSVPAMLLIKDPPFIKEGKKIKRDLWNKRQVRLGSYAGLTAGAWRGILNSYIPVVLKSVGESYFLVGILVSLANGASIAGAGFMGFLKNRSPVKVFALGVACAAAGTAFIGLTARSVLVSGALLATGGIGAGILQTLGPTIAARGVSQQQRPDAVAIAGSFRAGALFAAPLLMAALLAPLGVTEALLVVGFALGLPVLSARGSLEGD